MPKIYFAFYQLIMNKLLVRVIGHVKILDIKTILGINQMRWKAKRCPDKAIQLPAPINWGKGSASFFCLCHRYYYLRYSYISPVRIWFRNCSCCRAPSQISSAHLSYIRFNNSHFFRLFLRSPKSAWALPMFF